jgi:hypothetical protein
MWIKYIIDIISDLLKEALQDEAISCPVNWSLLALLNSLLDYLLVGILRPVARSVELLSIFPSIPPLSEDVLNALLCNTDLW